MPQNNKQCEPRFSCRKLFKSISLIALYTILSVGFIELSLRVLGYTIHTPQALPSEPVYHQTDAQLGWKFIEGKYQVPVNHYGDIMALTIKPNIGRATKTAKEQDNKDKIILIGGSYTFGRGVNDQQTFAWKLQEKFQNVDIRNLAVGAYGTYQSLMVLENQLKKQNKPKTVIYGYIEHHPLRNVAESKWLEGMHHAAKGKKIKTPYVTLGKGMEINRRAPTEMVHLPFSNTLVSAYITQRLFNKALSYNREKDAGKLAQLLILEMQRLCKKHGINFYVALLYRTPQDPFIKSLDFFDHNQIKYIDSHVDLTEKNIIRQDRHPDESVQNIWAERIAERLEQDNVY